MYKNNFITLAISLMITSTFIQANTELDRLMAMSIEELLQVEVTGSTRTEENILTVPSSVTIFTHEEIKRFGATTVNELMNYVPGFQSRSSAESSALTKTTTTRGHTSGTASRDILVLMDGQRVNGDWNGGSGTMFTLIPLENVKKIEFIRGAGSSLYGSNAFSAVINITTLDDVNELNTRISSHSAQASALVSIKDEDIGFSGFIKGVNDTGKDYSNLKNNVLNSTQTSSKDPYDSIDLYLQAKYKDLSVYFSYNRRTSEDFYAFARLSDDHEREIEQTYIRVKYETQVSSKLSSQVAVSFSKQEDYLKGEIVHQGFLFPQDNLLSKGKIKEDTPSIELFNSYKINNNHSFQFGAEYRKPKIKKATVYLNYDLSNGFPFAYNPNYFSAPLGKTTSRDIYGIFTQYQGQILEDLDLTLGLRYDDYSDFGDSVNPRASLVYRAFEETSFKLLYSRAFRAPSRNELDLQNSGTVAGNPDLDPEIINSYEAIIVQQFQKHSISLSYYVNMIDDIIIDSNSGNQRENAGDGTFRGLELEYIGSFFENFQLRTSYSRILSKPDFAYRSSRDISSLILNYNIEKINFNFSGFYNSHVENFDKSKVPSYLVFNTKLTYKLDERASLFFQMENIFDKEYYSPSEGSQRIVNIPNRGRETFGGLEITF